METRPAAHQEDPRRFNELEGVQERQEDRLLGRSRGAELLLSTAVAPPLTCLCSERWMCNTPRLGFGIEILT